MALSHWLEKNFGRAIVRYLGIDLPERVVLEFLGDGVSVVDDQINKVTKVTIPGGGGGGGTTPPTVTAISPSLGDIHGGVPVTLTGSGFVAGMSFAVGGTTCTGVVVISATQATAIAPAKAAGTYDVTATTAGGTGTLAGGYEAWHPTVDAASFSALRVFQADRGVTSGGAATRQRVGLWQDPLRAGFIERDGATMLRLASGRVLLLGGWDDLTHAEWGGLNITNEILKSDDNGRTWTVLLAHDSAPPTSGAGARFKPGHTAGVLVHTHAGVEYVYWIGSDANAGVDRDGGVWRSSDGGSTWERISTAAPTSGKSLFMVASFGGALYVMGGQTDLADTLTATNSVHRSTDGGVTWSTLTAAPWAARGAVYSPVVYQGFLWVVGGATYHNTIASRTFYNDVWKFDGTTWTQVLATGHAQWPARHYHSVVVYDSKLWIVNGFASTGNLASAHYSADGATWTDAGTVPWVAVHAQSACVVGSSLLVTQGIAGTGLYAIESHVGSLVSAWADQGAGALSLTQATDAAKPILDVENVFAAQPGVCFTKGQLVRLAAPDAAIAGGVYEAWFVAKTLNTDSTPQQPTIQPACVVVGNQSAQAFNEFGFHGDTLRYHDGAGSWVNVARGSGLNTDRVRLCGVEHQNASCKIYVGDAQQGATGTGVGFSTTYTGWDCIGAGLNGDDAGEFALGAAIVIKSATPSSAAFRAKLNTWAKKWGAIT